MTSPVADIFPVAGSLAAATLAWPGLQRSRLARTDQHRMRDFAFIACAGVWMLHLLASTLLEQLAGMDSSGMILWPASLHITYFGYHAVITSVCFFLLVCSGVTSSKIYGLLAIQAAIGIGVIFWQQEPLQLTESRHGLIRPSERLAWIAANAVMAAITLAALARRLYLSRSLGASLTFAAAVMGSSLLADGVRSAGDAAPFASLTHYSYAFFLLVIWRLAAHSAIQTDVAATSADFQPNSAFEAITGFDIASVAASTAVASERRRIAQELHDGVGSQIVSILSSLDDQIPQQQTVVLALEQCLVDLKMTVDAIDSEDDNLLDALGRLRYRVQHSLDRLGITMVWNIEMSSALENVRGVDAQQALRITQESLANVMRHSHASEVVVSCRVLKNKSQLVLEVADNGHGIARKDGVKRMGKGIEGMLRRAREAGGHLRIASKPGKGTCLKLTIPLGVKRPVKACTKMDDSVFASSVA